MGARRRIDEPALQEAVRAHGYDAQRICEHFGISRRHLQRWFRLHMQSTPNVWLAELRMQHARRLLATSNSVKEVAYSLGFKQASQFSRDFKRRFGHQPSLEKRASFETVAAAPRSSQASWRCELGAVHAVLQG